jgi:hypothetical protein
MYMRPLPNGSRDYFTAQYTAQCTDEQPAESSHELRSVEGGIFENILY